MACNLCMPWKDKEGKKIEDLEDWYFNLCGNIGPWAFADNIEYVILSGPAFC